MKASILLAIKREKRNRRSDGFRDGLHGKRETKSLSDAVITHVTQVTVEDAPATELEEATELEDVPMTKLEEATEDTRSLREIWEQECDVGISYKTFLQRMQTQKWDLQKALHTPKAR